MLCMVFLYDLQALLRLEPLANADAPQNAGASISYFAPKFGSDNRDLLRVHGKYTSRILCK